MPNLLPFIVAVLPLVGFAYVAWNVFQLFVWKKIQRQSNPPVWERTDENVLSAAAKLYLAQHSEGLDRLGFQPLGTWVGAANQKFKTYATCFLHPQGHYVVQVVQAMEFNAIEINSVLDDGSTIETSNANVDENHFAEELEFGFLVQISPSANVEDLIALHESASQPAAQSVGLRKLTKNNWTDYLRYSYNFHNQCSFEVGKKDNPPAECRLPNGECVATGSNNQAVPV